MTEVQKPMNVKELLKYSEYSGIDDYEIVVEINHEKHNLDFIVDGIRKKIIFFYEYGDGDDVLNELFDKTEQLKKENEQLKETNQELYDFRLVLNALLFNEWAETGKYEVYKSKRHHDGEPCFDGEWFIVVAILPSGQVTNHYHIKYWDYFKIPSYERVKDEFDGHTSSVVLLRYGVLLE